MTMVTIFNSITLIALMILIGMLLSRSIPFNSSTQHLFINLIVNIAMPCIILSSIFNIELTSNILGNIQKIFLLSILVNLIGIALGYGLVNRFYKGSKNKAELAIMAGLGNTAFIGIPLCAALFGPEGALYAAIFDAGVDVTIWTVGIFLLQDKMSFSIQLVKKIFNMPLIAVAVGLTLSFLSLKPPSIFIELTDSLAVMAAPLAMIYIGLILMDIYKRGVIKVNTILFFPLISKLILLPVLTAFIIYFMPLQLIVKQVIIVQAMMPTLTLASVLFAKYSKDEDLGAVTTLLSILLSFSTIPIMLLLMNLFIH